LFARVEWCFVFYFPLESLATSHMARKKPMDTYIGAWILITVY